MLKFAEHCTYSKLHHFKPMLKFIILILYICPSKSLVTLPKILLKSLNIMHLSNNNVDTTSINLSDTLISNVNNLSIRTESELKTLMDNMPLHEKYSLLVQSYSTNIFEGKNKPERNIEALKIIESLYNEMIQKSIAPDSKAAQAFIDSAATFCNAAVMSKTIRFIKASNLMKCFGLGISQLSVPINRKQSSPLMKIKVPTDDRKIEVLYASLITGFTALWIALQIGTLVESDIHPWLAIYNVFLLALGGFDISVNKGERIRQAASGIERLILSDNERQAHCDSAAFLVGYLLGLPCFCFKPDVIEAVKLLREYPDSLNAYKQPAAALIKSQNELYSNNLNIFSKLFQGSSKSTMNEQLKVVDLENNKSTVVSTQRVNLDADLSLYTDSIKDLETIKLLGLGRLLVWLIAPVAAEALKYGKTILSDPQSCNRLFEVLSTIEKQNLPSNGIVAYDVSCIPSNLEDRQALLEWAYFEACTLIRQYGDLLEEVKLYMDVGTSTVGECIFMIEIEIS